MSETFGFVHLSSRLLIFDTTKQIPSIRIDNSANPSAKHLFLLLEHLHPYSACEDHHFLATIHLFTMFILPNYIDISVISMKNTKKKHTFLFTQVVIPPTQVHAWGAPLGA